MQSNPFPSQSSIDGFQRISGSCSSVEQMQLYTGNLFCRYSVVNVPTIGLPLIFDLIYNSQDPVAGPVGRHWRHNYMMRLELNASPSPTQITFISETSRRFSYSWNGSSWAAVSSSLFFPGDLTASGADYLITMRSGDKMTFAQDTGTFTITGTITNGTNTVTASLSDLNRLNVGDGIQHVAFPGGTTVTAISEAGGNFTASNNATATAAGASITVTVSPKVYRLKNIVDVHGFTTALTYNTAGQLTTITDPNGNRTISLGYNASGLVNSISEPNGQAANPTYSTTLSYDTSVNLTTITSPELCVTTYGYSTPSNHRMTSRTDPNSKTVTFGYALPSGDAMSPVNPLSSLYQLTSVTDPDSNQILYLYDRVSETTGLHPTTTSPFNRTRLVEARAAATVTGNISVGSNSIGGVSQADLNKLVIGQAIRHAAFPAGTLVTAKYEYNSAFVVSNNAVSGASQASIDVLPVWEYRFDSDGNLWRFIDPLTHHFRFRWDSDQQLTYVSGPFKQSEEFRDNMNNSFSFRAYDLSDWKAGGNLIYATDPSGRIDHFVYDSKNHLTDVFPGQGNLAIQGQWTDHFGKDGYVLCAFDDANGDREQRPAYIAPISTNFTRQHDVDTANNAVYWKHLMDPRLPVAPDSLTRHAGFWKQSSGTSFTFNLALASPYTDKKFNVSFYTHSADMPYSLNGTTERVNPLTYAEQFGRDVTITVTDADGTQSFRVYNNAPGAWVTFSVHATSSTAVQVTVAASGPNNTDARISAICFDPYENHRISYSYNSSYGDLETIKQWPSDGSPNTTTLAYDATSKLLTSITDPRNHATTFNYDATYKDVTSIVDRLSKTWRMTYDNNANLLTFQDPVLYGINPSLKTVTYTYDKKNRVKTVTDALSHQVTYTYDNAGNLTRITDANNKNTDFQYTSMNRLWKIIDALSQQTIFAYDASGNLTSITDPRSNVTTFTLDAVGRVTNVVLPDVEPNTSINTKLEMAYDGLSRLVALTTPNGTQNDAASVNVLNAFNLLKNPGAEVADPADSTKAQFWAGTASYSPAIRDTSTPAPGPYSGSCSFRSSAGLTPRTWGQDLLLPPGIKAYLSSWAMSDGYPTTSNQAYPLNNQGTPQSASGANVRLDGTDPYRWQAIPVCRFDIPGDSQHQDVNLKNDQDGQSGGIRAQFADSGTFTIWLDDFRLHSLSSSMMYDRGGNLMMHLVPDGGTNAFGYDRLGRLVRLIDARGRVWQCSYDSMDRVVTITEPRGMSISFSYDANGNLASVIDANGNTTSYAYNYEDRLTTITYPDSTTESLTYDDAGRVYTYTNNRSQQRTMAYDNGGRLTSVTYNTDSTAVSFTYDNANNLLTITERNGDVTTFTLDSLYRVIKETRTLGTGSATAPWTHRNGYDANSNRVELDYVYGDVYDSAVYDTGVYGDVAWVAPTGYDEMDRLESYQDYKYNQTTFAYDLESHVKSVTYPNGLVTTPTYDIMGRVVDLNTTVGAGGSSILSMSNGYDIASNRNSLVVGNDTFDYGFDEDGQLVEEAINRFVERRYEHFQQGSLEALQLNPSGTLSLLAFNDDFSSESIMSDRWQLFASSLAVANVQVRQKPGLQQSFVQNSGLVIGAPIGYSDNVYATDRPTPSSYNGYGLLASNFWVNLQHKMQLSNNFEIQIDFKDFQAGTSSEVLTGLLVSDGPFPQSPSNYAFIGRGVDSTNTHKYIARVKAAGTLQSDVTANNTALTGKLRVARSSNTITLSYWDGSAWQALRSYAFGSLSSSLYVSLHYTNTTGIGSIRWQNFTQNDPSTHSAITRYATSGTYISRVYDTGAAAGRTVNWLNLLPTSSTPSGTSLSFEVATSKLASSPVRVIGDISNGSATVLNVSAADLANLAVGAPVLHQYFPTGTTVSSILSSSFTASNNATGTRAGSQIGSTWSWSYAALTGLPKTGRYGRYRVTFTGDGTATPTLTSVDLVYDGTTTSRNSIHAYDGVANLTERATTSTAAVVGTITSGSNNVTSVSGGDIAKVFVGAALSHPNFSVGTTVSTVSASSFTVSNNATASASGATIAISSTTSDLRHFGITGTITNASSTVSSVSSGDIAKLAVGYLVTHSAFASGTRIATVGANSFTVSNNATASASGASIDITFINNLNQIKRSHSVSATGSTTTYTYTHDNSGNLTQKSDGTNTWSYTWNEDNQLTQVNLPGGDNVQYRYDAAGRLLWRKKSTDTNPTKFEWDGMDIVRETAPDGTVTRLYVVNGVLMSFEVGGTSTYQVHADALGHVRMVTNSSGSSVYSANYDAWGNILAESGSLAGSWNYGFMGASGCRRDPDTGLVYARARWYSPDLQRFISRDALGGSNRYAYALNAPTTLIDSNGLEPGIYGDPKEIRRIRERAGYGGDDSDFWGVANIVLTGWAAVALAPAVAGEAGAALIGVGLRVGIPRLVGAGTALYYGARFAPAAMIGASRVEAPCPPARTLLVSPRGLQRIRYHLARPDFGWDPANDMMIARLQRAMLQGRRVTGADANFLLHEVSEETLMVRHGLPFVPG